MIFGIVLGIFSIITAIANGYLLGFVSLLVVKQAGISVLWKLFPHGIFELPALFISLGLGLRLGFWLFYEPIKFYWKNNKLILSSFILFYFPSLISTLLFDSKFKKIMGTKFEDFKNYLLNSLRVFIFVVIPLLILAAIIEGTLIFFVG